MFNPLTLFVPPAIIVLSVPLALFAAFTTSVAVSVLSVRVGIVYFEIAVALLQSWLFGDKFAKTVVPHPAPTSPDRPRSRRSSVPQNTHPYSAPLGSSARSDSFASLVGPSGPNRDFEGVAGWKDPNDHDEELWIAMNARLELPLGTAGDSKRRHQRSHTAGSLNHRRSGSMRMSPVESRARTPVAPDGGPDEYFPMQHHGRRPNTSEGTQYGKERRRKNSSGSSSSGGSRLTLSTVKFPGV